MNPEVKVDEHGTKTWRFHNGILHRTDGPAEEWADGSKAWRVNGKLHREDGPAVEYVDGYKAWYLNDKFHREDGPAIEWTDGSKEWYLNDKPLSKEGFTSLDQIIKMQALELFTPQEIIRMRLDNSE